jgi:hypothetical protein
MTPTVDERLASIVRSLTEVILPHLPDDASLAQEQVQLAIGHLQILRSQLDNVPAYEREELVDSVAVAKALIVGVSGGAVTSAAIRDLSAVTSAADGSDVRGQTTALNKAVDALVKAVSADGAADAKASLSRIILEHEKVRVLKDRKWFLPFGFDTILETAA